MIARWIHRTSDRVAAWSPRTKRIVTFAVLALAFALPLRGLLRNQGPPMEEGFMLVFPERVLHGDFPNKDFLHLYGPGSLWVLAGLDEGPRRHAHERAALRAAPADRRRRRHLLAGPGVGPAPRALLRAAVAALHRPAARPHRPRVGRRRRARARSGSASPWPAGAGSRADPTLALRYAFFGGLVGAGALLFRLDLVVAVVLGALAATAGLGAAFKKRYALGLGIGLLAYVVQLATAGPYNTFKGMVLDPVVYLRGGRRLPIPPSWDHLDGPLQEAVEMVPGRRDREPAAAAQVHDRVEHHALERVVRARGRELDDVGEQADPETEGVPLLERGAEAGGRGERTEHHRDDEVEPEQERARRDEAAEEREPGVRRRDEPRAGAAPARVSPSPRRPSATPPTQARR